MPVERSPRGCNQWREFCFCTCQYGDHGSISADLPVQKKEDNTGEHSGKHSDTGRTPGQYTGTGEQNPDGSGNDRRSVSGNRTVFYDGISVYA